MSRIGQAGNSDVAFRIAHEVCEWTECRSHCDVVLPFPCRIDIALLGRKNHYGSRSKRGTEVAAQLYTILETAKLSDVDARAYLQIAVYAALDGNVIPLPHECLDAIAARAAENIIAATEHLATEA
jgi:hypothetical protein